MWNQHPIARACWLILLFLVGCSPVTQIPSLTPTINPFTPPVPQITPTVTPTILPATATVVPASTQIVTDTPSPTLISTLPDTLEPEIARATIQPLSNDPMNCGVVPCFWGIIPGNTPFDEAKNIFHRLRFTPFEGKDQNENTGLDFYSVAYPSNSGPRNRVTLYAKNNLVENIVVTPDIAHPKEGRSWPAYSPETLITQFGKPSRVKFAIDWGPNFVISMIMYFDEVNLIVWYNGYNMIPDRPHSPRLCPLSAPFDLVRVWMGRYPPYPPSFEMIWLEAATSLTIDQFTQLMLGDPQKACFTLNGDLFQ